MAGCGDVLSLEDLQTAKKHQIFEAEVITGKVGGVAGGASIDTATNPVTGQTQQTLPSLLADLGFDVQSWTSSTGGVLASANQVFLNDTPGSLGLGDYYAWGGAFPKTVPAGTDPALPTSGYIMRSSRFAGTQAREALRRSYAEAGYNLVDGSFEEGGILTSASDVLLHKTTAAAYAWSGAFPKVVNAGSTPATSGGIGAGAWVDRTDLTFRSDLASESGSGLVGYQPAGTGAVATNVQSKLREMVSVLDFYANGVSGARVDPTGVIDSTAGIQDALNSNLSNTVYAPKGNYKITSTITIPENVSLVGCGYQTNFVASSVTGPVFQFGFDGVMTSRVSLRHVRISGTATKAVSLNNSLNCIMEDVHADGTFTDAFYFRHVYPGHFKSLSTSGATVLNACYYFGDEVNACLFDNLYTSTFCQYNFLWDGTGHGSVFNSPTAQGGRYGFYVKSTGFFGGLTVNGLYEENTARPIVLGVIGSSSAIAVNFNGAMLAGPFPTHPYYSESGVAIDINNADGCTFSGIDFLGTLQTSGGFPSVTFTGNGSGAHGFVRVNPDGSIHSVEVLTPGSGYTTCTAAITGGGGVNATLSVNLSGGLVASVTVTAAGSGYKRPQTPMAIRYGLCTKIKFSGCRTHQNSLGINAPLYPYLCANSAASNGYLSSLSIDDVSVRNGSIGGSANVMKMTTNGTDWNFAVVEYTAPSGTQSVYKYVAPFYPS